MTLKLNLRGSNSQFFFWEKLPNPTYQQNSQDKACILRLPNHVSYVQGSHV